MTEPAPPRTSAPRNRTRLALAAAGELIPLLFLPPLFLAAGVGWLIVGRTREAIAYFAARSAALMLSFAVIVFFILDETHRGAERRIEPVAYIAFYAALIAAPITSAVILLLVEVIHANATSTAASPDQAK